MGLRRKTVAVLPYRNDKVLMQLRDEKPTIVYPGNWGFFGGDIDPGEKPIQGAKRELYEEIKYEAKEIYALSINRIFAPDEILIIRPNLFFFIMGKTARVQ